MGKPLLKFTDEDGDPIYCANDIVGIFTNVEKNTVSDMFGPVRTTKAGNTRGIISQSTGQWRVRESYEEILAQIDMFSNITEATCASSA